jgi:hypothetical protein
LVVCLPCSSHTQKGGMSDSLCIGGNTVVHLTGKVDMLRTERGEDGFDEFEAFVRGAVLDQDLYHGVTMHVWAGIE